MADDQIEDIMVIAIDPGILMNPHAYAVENLFNIYIGSEQYQAGGAHLCQVNSANRQAQTGR
jgi:hypothetical protein